MRSSPDEDGLIDMNRSGTRVAYFQLRGRRPNQANSLRNTAGTNASKVGDFIAICRVKPQAVGSLEAHLVTACTCRIPRNCDQDRIGCAVRRMYPAYFVAGNPAGTHKECGEQGNCRRRNYPKREPQRILDHLTVKLGGRAQEHAARRERKIAQRARGVPPRARHGPLQRLLEGTPNGVTG